MRQEHVTTVGSLRNLLADLIDYAGLFPPSALPMSDAVANHARYLKSPDAWALGRFVVPASRLFEFEREWMCLESPVNWRLTVLLSGEEELEGTLKFGLLHPDRIIIESVELKSAKAEEIGSFRAIAPPAVAVYVELPAAADPEPFVMAAADSGARVKIRTGGVKPEMIPGAESVARILQACAAHRVAFKATAGLHHPLRCLRPLTYESDSLRGTMHGFVNVFAAAMLAWKGSPVAELRRVLEDEDAGAFIFGDDALCWRDRRVSLEDIRTIRKEFAVSFGSCSFEEPLADLRELGMLE